MALANLENRFSGKLSRASIGRGAGRWSGWLRVVAEPGSGASVLGVCFLEIDEGSPSKCWLVVLDALGVAKTPREAGSSCPSRAWQVWGVTGRPCPTPGDEGELLVPAGPGKCWGMNRGVRMEPCSPAAPHLRCAHGAGKRSSCFSPGRTSCLQNGVRFMCEGRAMVTLEKYLVHLVPSSIGAATKSPLTLSVPLLGGRACGIRFFSVFPNKRACDPANMCVPGASSPPPFT